MGHSSGRRTFLKGVQCKHTAHSQRQALCFHVGRECDHTSSGLGRSEFIALVRERLRSLRRLRNPGRQNFRAGFPDQIHILKIVALSANRCDWLKIDDHARFIYAFASRAHFSARTNSPRLPWPMRFSQLRLVAAIRIARFQTAPALMFYDVLCAVFDGLACLLGGMRGSVRSGFRSFFGRRSCCLGCFLGS